MSETLGAFDLDEAFWREIRELPEDVKNQPGMHEMFVFKSQVQMLNRNIEDAIRLKLAGWTASLPGGSLQIDRVFAWQWRRPGPRGGRLFLSTQQAINALRKELPSGPALSCESTLPAQLETTGDVGGRADKEGLTYIIHEPHPIT